MAEQFVLEAAKRDTIGKEVRHLRKAGIVPAVLYGPEFDALDLQVEWSNLRTTLLAAGGSNIITLQVGDETYNALVRDVQRSPVRGDVLHVDFYRVRMDVIIRTDVPVVVEGNFDKLIEEAGVITHEMTSVTVECLPTVLPSEVVISLEGITAVGDTLTVADLPQLEGVNYLADPGDVVVSSTYMRMEEEEEEEEEELFDEEMVEPELVRREDEEDMDDEEEV